MSLHFLSGEYGVSGTARAEYSGQNLTIAIWIKGEPASNAPTDSLVAAAGDFDTAGGRAGLALSVQNWFNTGDTIKGVTVGDFWGVWNVGQSSGSGGEDNTWNLYVVRSSTDFSTTGAHNVWKNGTQQGAGDTNEVRRYAGSNLKAGVMCDPADPTDTAFHSNGKTLAHFAVWSSYLSDAEIIALAAGDNPLTVDAENLVDYWPLLTDGSNSVDALNPLTLTGTPDEDADNPTVDDPPGGGGETHTGTGALRLANFAINSSAVMEPDGTAALSLANFTIAGTGAEEISATAALSLANMAINATATFGDEAQGTAALTLANYVLAADADESMDGAAALSLANFALAASGNAILTEGQAALILANFVLSATGVETIDAEAALNLAAMVIDADGALPVTGTAALQFRALRISTAAIGGDSVEALRTIAHVIRRRRAR